MSTRTITSGQIALLRTIAAERAVEGHTIERLEARIADGIPQVMMADIMAWLKRAPKREALTLDVDVTPRAKVTELGFYKNETDEVYKVVDGMSGRYAKLTTPHGLEYVRGAITRLFADQKMTGEEVAAHGVANRYCVNCSHDLEDPTSKHLGLGTSCGPQILGKEGYKAAKARVAHFADVVAFEQAKKDRARQAREDKKREAAQLVLV